MKKYDIIFKNGTAKVKTASGSDAFIHKNDRNIRKPYYSLTIMGKTIFTRGSIEKVLEVLKTF